MDERTVTIPIEPATSTEERPAGSKGRRIAFGSVATLFGLASAGGLGFGLVFGWFSTEDGGIHRVHLLGFGILHGILLAPALFALSWRPERRPSAFWQVVAVAVAGVVAAALSLSASYLAIAGTVVVATAILFALHPDRRSVLRARPSPSRPLLAFAAVASVPLVVVAFGMASLQRTGLAADPHVSQDHWANMAAMALGIALVGLLAAARIRGWVLAAWGAGLAAAVYGIASLVFDRFPGTDIGYPGSAGTLGGVVAVVAGLAFIALGEREARRRRG
jgi:hypothetical protein